MTQTTYGHLSPALGAPAPDFALRDQHGVEHRLSESVADKHALLVFFPFAFSGICTSELLDIQLNIDRFANDAVQVYGLSCDASPALKSWAAIEGYRFPLLSDFWPHGAVTRDYGVLLEEAGMPVRGTFLVDPGMSIVWSLISGPGQPRDIAVLHGAVKDL